MEAGGLIGTNNSEMGEIWLWEGGESVRKAARGGFGHSSASCARIRLTRDE